MISRAELLAANERLRIENAQLQTALTTRIVLEQAKGVLMERHCVSADDAFEILRHDARRSRQSVHIVAADVLKRRPSKVTP